MEISLQKNNTIRIKTKNAIISLDRILQDSDIVIKTLYHPALVNDPVIPSNNQLIIQGPGEYELKGVHMTATENNNHTLYEISADSMKMLILPSTNLTSIEEDGMYTGLIVYMLSDIKDNIFSNTSKSTLILFGDTSWIHLASENLKKASKVNLKKTEEFEGSAVLLSS